jgi:hypothetical protein
MPISSSPELSTTFRALSDLVYAEESFDSMYDALCRSAVELVDGADHVSLMVSRNGRVRTVAASDDLGRSIDRLEQTIGEGPCLDAIDDAQPDQHLCTDLTTDNRWPRLAAAILESTQVKGMAGFRIRQDGQRVGALNVFSDTPGALTEHSLDQAVMLTAFSSVALAALDRGEEATTLRRGLESNREIGKAIGLLMAMHDIDDDQAFQMLTQVSQEMNVKLAQVATQVLTHHRSGGS